MTTETKQRAIAAEVMAERKRQAEKFPASERGLPDGTGASGYKTYCDIARNSCDRADREGRVTMAHIFEEETLEVLAEEDPTKLRVELVQVAAVCMKWIEELDRREPRVVSGLDTAAATPEPACTCVAYWGRDTHDGGCPQLIWSKKYRQLPEYPPPPPARPSRVEVGQRRRFGGTEYKVLAPSDEFDGLWDIETAGRGIGLRGDDVILADEYLGTVPAPVSAPAGEATMWQGSTDGKTWYDCPRETAWTFVHYRPKPDASPGQSTPMETPPTEPVKPERPTCDTPGCGRPIPVGGEGDPEICPKCLREEEAEKAARSAAAPAPGVGEGPRELTFAEAMALDPSEVEVKWDDINDWRVVASILTAFPLESWRVARYRRRPEPLPAPAPRVSRAIELADDYMAGTQDRVRAVGIAVLAVEETLDAVRRKAVDAGWSDDQLDALDLVRGGACAAMLEPR